MWQPGQEWLVADVQVNDSEEFATLRISDVVLLTIPSIAYFGNVLLAGLGMLFIPASICFMVQVRKFNARVTMTHIQLFPSSTCIHNSRLEPVEKHRLCTAVQKPVYVLIISSAPWLTEPVSTTSGMQASCIIFTALFSAVFLNRKLNSLHLRGITAAVVGVGVVSYAGLVYTRNQKLPPHLAPAMASAAGGATGLPAHATHLLLGVSLTLASQVCQVRNLA